MAIANGLNPNVDSISFRTGTAIITSGVAGSDAAIKLDVGTLAAGSIYIDSNVGSVWVMVVTTWTKLTIN
jgi:hypothetical protein